MQHWQQLLRCGPQACSGPVCIALTLSPFTQLECSCEQLLTPGQGQPEPLNHGCPDRQQQYTAICGNGMVLFAVDGCRYSH